MVIPFGRTLFGLAAILVVTAAAPAQDQEFEEAVKLLRMGQRDEALEKLREVMQADPSNEDALRMYRNTDQDIWYMLVLEEGEIGMIAQSLLDRAKMQRRELSRDEVTIAELANTACSGGNNAERRGAIRALVANHGAYAVPALVRRMQEADGEAVQINAIVALYNLGAAATLPLIEVLGSDNANARQAAAAALSQIGDPRAAAALARLVQVDDQESVRDIARRTLPKLDVQPGADPVDLYLADARAHLEGRGPGRATDVVWSLEGGELVYAELPELLYELELAKKNAHAALILDPLSQAALTLVAQTYLAQIAVIKEADEAGDPAFADFSEHLDGLRWVAMATGPATLQRALDDALARDLNAVAEEAIEALKQAAPEGGVSEEVLGRALESTDARIRELAALAIASLSGGMAPAQLRGVIAALSAAVSEESKRVIKVIDSAPTAAAVAVEASGRGNSYQVIDSAVAAIGQLYSFPNVDVVVVNEVLDRLPEDVISLIRRDPRMEQVKVLVVANDVDAAMDRFGDTVDGVIQGPLNVETLQSEVATVLEGVEMDRSRLRADQVAESASQALMVLAENQVNVAPALGSLTTQLDRSDEIAIPAAAAIGAGGSVAELGFLLSALQSGNTSLELKVACADAAGRIMGRANQVPAEVFEGMMAVLESEEDSALRLTVATALGKAPLVPGNRLRLMELLRTVGE